MSSESLAANGESLVSRPLLSTSCTIVLTVAATQGALCRFLATGKVSIDSRGTQLCHRLLGCRESMPYDSCAIRAIADTCHSIHASIKNSTHRCSTPSRQRPVGMSAPATEVLVTVTITVTVILEDFTPPIYNKLTPNRSSMHHVLYS